MWLVLDLQLTNGWIGVFFVCTMVVQHLQGGAVAPEATALRNLSCVITAAEKWTFAAFIINKGIKNTPR